MINERGLLVRGILLYSVGGGLLSCEMGRNIIELLSALASEDSSSLRVLRLLHKAELGELLKDVTLDLTSGNGEVAWSATESLWTTKDLSQSTNTNVGSDVNTTSDSSGTSVHPVGVIGSKLLEGRGLNEVSPLERK